MAKHNQQAPEKYEVSRLSQWSLANLLILLSAVLVRLPWIFTVPSAQAPDELTHYWVVAFLRDHLRLPEAAEVASGGIMAVYGSLPPIAYLPHVALSALFPHNPLLFARLGSLFMGLLTIYASILIAKELFAERRLLRWSLPAILVFHPQLVFINSYCNNDSTACALASLSVYVLVLFLKYGLTIKRSLGLGVLLGLLALGKYSGYVIAPVAAIALVMTFAIHASSIAVWLPNIFSIGLVASVICGWWFWRNAQQYPGDVLGTHTMYITWAKSFHKSLNYQMPFAQIMMQPRWWRMFFYSFWAVFGYMTVYLPRPIYFIYTGYLLTAVGGWISSFKNRIKLDWQMAVWIMMLACCLINLGAMLWAGTGNLGGPQGRYFLVSEIPFMVLMLEGLWRLPAKINKIAIIGFVCFNALVCLGAWLMLFGLYQLH